MVTGDAAKQKQSQERIMAHVAGQAAAGAAPEGEAEGEAAARRRRRLKRKHAKVEDNADEVEGLEETFGWLKDIPPQDESWLHFAMFSLLESQG